MAILFYLWTRRCDPGGFRDVRPLVDPRPPGGLGHPVHTFQSRDSRLSTGAVRDWRAVARVHRWNLYREHLYDAHVGLILVGPANRRQRASTRQMKCSPLKGVRSGQNCPQLRVSTCRILEHSREFTKFALLAGTLSGKERVNQRPTRPAARESGGPAYRNILAR